MTKSHWVCAAVVALAAATAQATPFCVLSVEETRGTLAIVTPQGEVRARVALGPRPHEVAVSADGATAYVSMFGIADYDNRIGTPGTTVAQIDLGSARQVGAYQLPADVQGPHGVKLRPEGAGKLAGPGELFVNAEVGGDAMLVFDVKSRALLRRFALPPATHNFIFSNDGTVVFSFAGAHGVTRTDAATGKPLASRDYGVPVRGLLLEADGSLLAGAKDAVLVLDAGDLSVIRRLPTARAGQVVYLDRLADGTIFAPAIGANGVSVLPGDGVAASFTATGKTPIFARTGPDGRIYVANVEDDHISVLDARGAVVQTIGGLVTPNGLGFGDCPTR
jgi:YVTN family beta-propeller protein